MISVELTTKAINTLTIFFLLDIMVSLINHISLKTQHLIILVIR